MTQWPVWATVFLFAFTLTLIWSVGETRVPMTTLTSGAAWSWLAFQPEITTQTGTQPYPQLRWLFAFMAVINLLGLFLYMFGDFPPAVQDTDAGARASPSENT